MRVIWVNAGRNLRYRTHQSRKHGQRPDRFWQLHYTLDKRTRNEAVGWDSQGVTKAYCQELLAELRRNWRTGAGPRTLKELRADRSEKKAVATRAEAAQSRTVKTVGQFWSETVRPEIRLTYAKHGNEMNESVLKVWLKPLLNRPLPAISATDLEDLVIKPMLAAGRRPATIQGVLRLFSVIWQRAKKLNLVQGESPVRNARRPKADNRRVRFLTPAEAGRLLTALWERSPDAHDLALMSLFTGLRVGECSTLTWADVDFENGLIFVKEPKNGESRHAFIIPEVEAMLKRRRLENPPKAERVFCGPRGGAAHRRLLILFRRIVASLGLNQDITDSRQRLVFHSLRHTYASWLVQKGQPLYTVSKLMGHRLIKMTERYAHLAPEIQKAAVSRLQGFFSETNEVKLRESEKE